MQDPFKGPENKKAAKPVVIVGAGYYGICAGGVATGKVALNEPVIINQLSDLEDLDINAAYDANHFVLVHDHVSEFFRLAPDRPLVLMLVDQGMSLTEMCDLDNPDGLVKLVDFEQDNGFEEVRVPIETFGVIRNPAVKGAIHKLNITAGGAGYAVNDVIAATNGDGAGFTAVVSEVDGGGAITGVTITNRGTNYDQTLPTTFGVSGGGSGATFTAEFYSATLTNGFDGDCITAIPKAQELVAHYEEKSVYIDNIIMECREFNGTIANAQDFSLLVSPNVLPEAGQDPYVASKNAAYSNYAAVGARLGMEAVRMVSEDSSSVDIHPKNKPNSKLALNNYTLTDYANSRFTKAALSGGQSFKSLSEADRKALHEKHISFVGSYEGYAGKYFSGNLTCQTTNNSFHRTHHNKVWNKAARIVRQTLLPKMKGQFEKDTDGNVASAAISSWEGKVNDALKRNMLDRGEISDFTYKINPTLENGAVTGQLNLYTKGILDEIQTWISKDLTI